MPKRSKIKNDDQFNLFDLFETVTDSPVITVPVAEVLAHQEQNLPTLAVLVPAQDLAFSDQLPPADLPAPVVRRVRTKPVPATTLGRDFRILDTHEVGRGGPVAKLKDNLDAIRILKAIERENREATEEEKAKLVRYTGWGSLSKVFDTSWNGCWRFNPEQYKKYYQNYFEATPFHHAAYTLRTELLTEDEVQEARASTTNAHYTSPLVIQFLWKALQKLGVTAGLKIWEPGCGVGHFFGLMPEELKPGTQRIGVEKDSITARIAQQLYPDSKILHSPIEKTKFADGFFDLVVGNVPFANVGVLDEDYKRNRKTYLCTSLHDYCLAKSLDKLRPGGLLALITSRYTLDKQDQVVREYLAAQSRLVQFFRLPNTAFQENAGTQVTTDILILQKKNSLRNSLTHS